MGGIISDAAEDRGDYARRQAELARDLAQARTARRGQATSVGAGGTRYHSGGGITVDGGGGIDIEGGSIRVSEGSVIVRGPGTMRVIDGAHIRAHYPSGDIAVTFGAVGTAGDSSIQHSTGLYVWEEESGSPIWWAAQRSDGGTEMITGATTGPIDRVWFRTVEWRVDAAGDFVALADGAAYLGGDGGGTHLQPESTGDAANMYMASDGRVFRSTSSARYKTDIADLSVDPDVVLQMRPRSWLPGETPHVCPPWRHAQHAEHGPCPADDPPTLPEVSERRRVGFVAEELVELGLTDFVEFVDGQPEAIYYDRLAAALIPLLQRQQAQIDALTARLDALEPEEE